MKSYLMKWGSESGWIWEIVVGCVSDLDWEKF
jgi:hypothetical protein